MDLVGVLERARKQLAEVTGLKPMTVTRAVRDEEGWHVAVEMVELSRVLPVSDVLGEYETLLNDDGEMLSFERKRTRLRGEPFEE